MKRILIQIITGLCVIVCFYACDDKTDYEYEYDFKLKMTISDDTIYSKKNQNITINVEFEKVEFLSKLLISKKTGSETKLYKSITSSDISSNSYQFSYTIPPDEDDLFNFIFIAYNLDDRAIMKTVCINSREGFTLENLTTLSRVTGKNLTGETLPNPNNTIANYSLSATDLGIIWEIEKDKVGIFFGDSYGGDFVPGPTGGPNNGNDWRSNVLAFSENKNLDNGLIFSGMAMDANNNKRAREIVPRRMYKSFTSIPTSAICVNGVQYVHYMDWQVFGGEEELNYSSIYRSMDNGKSWHSCEDKVKFKSFSKFGMIGYAKRDGYVYMVGTEIGRKTSARLARIKEEYMLDYNEYEYWDGENKIWSKGDESRATVILDGTVGELSVMYHEKYQCWIVMYFDEEEYAICYRTASELNGTWSKEHILVSGNDYPQLYGSYMHPFANNGDQIYFTMSLWSPYNVFFMRADIVIKE